MTTVKISYPKREFEPDDAFPLGAPRSSSPPLRGDTQIANAVHVARLVTSLSAPPIRHEVIMGQSFWDVSVDTVELSTKIVRDRMYATGGMGWVRLIYSCNPVTE